MQLWQLSIPGERSSNLSALLHHLVLKCNFVELGEPKDEQNSYEPPKSLKYHGTGTAGLRIWGLGASGCRRVKLFGMWGSVDASELQGRGT